MKTYLIMILIIIILPVYSDLIEVDIDGNHDYISIQAAIENAEDGDEILVYPGEYFENVCFLGKQIELKSLFADTEERHYITETIINGNGAGSCLHLAYNLNPNSITGFTLTGGTGTRFEDENFISGGGISLHASRLDVVSCKIKGNGIEALTGGGIVLVLDNYLYLSDTQITENRAKHLGGGIWFTNGWGETVFDPVNRCSIYNNYATMGTDIYSNYEGGYQEIYLDTLSVADYVGFNIYQFSGAPNWFSMNNLMIDYQNVWMEPVDADLYVSPDGDDNNTGLSWDEPLKSITWAFRKIAVNAIEPRTIYLDEGVYSVSNTGEIMPFQAKDCITLCGVSEQTTIIDGENESTFFLLSYGENNFCMENIRFINSCSHMIESCLSYYSILTYCTFTGEFNLRNLIFENNDPWHNVMALSCIDDAHLENFKFLDSGITNTPWSLDLMMWNDNGEHHEAYLNNIEVSGCNTGKIILDGRRDNHPDIYVSNFLSTDNFVEHGPTGFSINTTLLALDNGVNGYLINSTLANNIAVTPPTSGAVYLGCYCSLEVINSIIYGNGTDYAIISDNEIPGYQIDIHHSLIEGGIDGVYSLLPFNWDYSSNLDCYPMFSFLEEHPLSLLEDSPCIDAGTTVMPDGFTLPETDIMGNARIIGEGIDMGAYEYNPWSTSVTEEFEMTDLKCYPNPVRINEGRGALVIRYPGILDEDGYMLKIYNTKGQVVRVLGMSKGYSGISWDCCNYSGNIVGSGVYFLRLMKDNSYMAQKKITVVK